MVIAPCVRHGLVLLLPGQPHGEGGVPPPPKGRSKNAASPDAAAQESAAARAGPAARHRTAESSAGASTAARYEQLALSFAPWRRREAPGRADRHERAPWGHALSQVGLAA